MSFDINFLSKYKTLLLPCGKPCVRMVLSRATTGFPLSTQSKTAGEIFTKSEEINLLMQNAFRGLTLRAILRFHDECSTYFDTLSDVILVSPDRIVIRNELNYRTKWPISNEV